MAKRIGMFKVKGMPLAFCIWALLWSCHFVLAGNEPTLSETLKTFFGEENIPAGETKAAEVDVFGLWEWLGVYPQDPDSTRDVGLSVDGLLQFRIADEKIPVCYQIHLSGKAARVRDKYAILEVTGIRGPFGDNELWQLLVYRKTGNYWFKGDILGANEPYGLQVDFHKTPDGSLLFSVRKTTARGTGLYLCEWDFYKLIDGELKKVLTTQGRAHVDGWGLRFNREFEAQLWPTYYTWPGIGMTYYITYDTSGYYCGLSDYRTVDLFRLKKDVCYVWDADKKEFLLDEESSELSRDGIDALWNDGEREFYEKYKERIVKLKSEGSEHQKKWARLFERSMEKSSAK
ncbi:MAG: SPFH domain-containing protein [Planctomycetota bacterium]|jgi:hypothetical protein